MSPAINDTVLVRTPKAESFPAAEESEESAEPDAFAVVGAELVDTTRVTESATPVEVMNAVVVTESKTPAS